MRVTFQELMINLTEYNGISFRIAERDIINRTADYIKMQYVTVNTSEFADYREIQDNFNNLCDFELFDNFDWNVNFVEHFVEIPDNALR